jgi:hypothetical protein
MSEVKFDGVAPQLSMPFFNGLDAEETTAALAAVEALRARKQSAEKDRERWQSALDELAARERKRCWNGPSLHRADPALWLGRE